MLKRLGPSAVALVASVACSTPDPPHREVGPQSSVEPDAPREPTIESPVVIVREVARSERAAEAVTTGVGAQLCEALIREDAEAIDKLLTAGFSGRFGHAQVERDGFVQRLLAVRAEFTVAERCKLKAVGFELADDETWARVEFDFELAGSDATHQARLDRGHVIARVEQDQAGAWQLARVLAPPFDSKLASNKSFVDVTAVVGASLDRDPEAERLRRELIDRRAQLTFGGLSVGDFDRDGFADLLVTIAGEGAWMLRNDGSGAFERSESLLPARDVGVFTLLIDLDGDQIDELISTAVVACANDRAELSYWVRKGKKWVPSPSPLHFAVPCRGYQNIRFEHIAAGDLDHDGQIDLVVSGYADSHSKGSDFNSYDAHDGLRNLVFFGRGGLGFEELGEARGLGERRYTYATAIHDFDSDGDQDLYAVNDYGSNTWLGNDGSGHFTPLTGPLSESGNSMGVSVVDLDGDLELDVYVSNMYSSAGNRLLPLVADQVDPATHRSLLAMAAGNSLYSREGGTWRETAGELGLRKAGWAWGHTVCDFDNDGTREVYVVNGLTSHSDAKAPDF